MDMIRIGGLDEVDPDAEAFGDFLPAPRFEGLSDTTPVDVSRFVCADCSLGCYAGGEYADSIPGIIEDIRAGEPASNIAKSLADNPRDYDRELSQFIHACILARRNRTCDLE